MGMFTAADGISHSTLDRYAVVGQLALSGELRRVIGVLPITIRAERPTGIVAL